MAIEPRVLVAIELSDGTIGRMQFYAEPSKEAIQKDIDKTNWGTVDDQGVTPISALSWKLITQEEFIEIGASR